MIEVMDGTDRADELHVLACTECPRISSASAKGWKAYRVDGPEDDQERVLGFYCPECAEREFGPH
jgi:hypothetical protein